MQDQGDSEGEGEQAPTTGSVDGRLLTRRRVIVGGAIGLGAIGLGGVGMATGVLPVPVRLRRYFQDLGTDGTIPAVPAGDVRFEQRTSAARGRDVGFFTAVPEGHGDGSGLPVCLILHGATATAADLEPFGFGKFLTAAVRAGAPPFVLAGADGGRTGWLGDGAADDPQTMLREEVPAWCDARGFDTSRMVGYGWSMGGFGVLATTLRTPGWLRRVAALSPAVGSGDEVDAHADQLVGQETALWCGTSDALYPNVQALARKIPGGPAIESYSKGAHTRGFWDRVTPDALAFVAAAFR